jgi:hypothetical protein
LALLSLQALARKSGMIRKFMPCQKFLRFKILSSLLYYKIREKPDFHCYDILQMIYEISGRSAESFGLHSLQENFYKCHKQNAYE